MSSTHETLSTLHTAVAQELLDRIKSGEAKTVTIEADNGNEVKTFTANVRIDTPQEIKYFKSGGILQYVLKQIAA